MEFRFSEHARQEMEHRQVPARFVEDVLRNPEQVVSGHGGTSVYQSRIDFGDGRMYLLRVVVDDHKEPAVVVTVYRTSKIDRYWSAP